MGLIDSSVAALSDRKLLPVATASLLALTAALIILGRPEAQGPLAAATPLLLLFSLLFGVLIIRFSAAGAAVLVVFVYLDLSEALVRLHFPSLLQLLVVALAFAAWLKRDTATLGEVLLTPLTAAIATWILMGFVSTAWAENRGVADERVIELVKAFALYVLATALMRNRHRLMQGLAALLASAALLGVLAAYVFITGDVSRDFGGLARNEQAQIYGDVFEARLAGPVGDPNLFAQMLLLVIPPAVLFGVSAGKRWKRMTALAVACLVLLTTALTYSRGAMLAVAVMAVMMLRPLHVSWKNAAIVAVAGLLVLVILPAGVTQRFLTVGEVLPGSEESVLRGDSSIAERRIYMAVAAAMFAREPISGVGIGNYPVLYDAFIGEVGSSARIYPRARPTRYPHNLFLEVAAETGIVGLALFALIIVAAWRGLRRAERAFTIAGDVEMSHIATALRISLIGFLVASLFLHLALARYLLLLFAFAASADRIGRAALERE